MRLTLLVTVCAALGLGIGACGDDGETDTDVPDLQETQDTSGETAAETVAETTAETTPTETVEETAQEVVATKVVWDDVYPIFAASCSPCHNSQSPGGGPSGGHSIGSSNKAIAYAASQKNANLTKCAGKVVGQCALIRIQDGSMPASGECRSDPHGAKCPDSAEQALIQQWIDDGMLEHN